MRISELTRYGISEQIVSKWQERLGETLLPIQHKAIQKGLLDHNSASPMRLIISGPTSSGKSFCAEMAAVRTLNRRQKAVMLFPLKSLAEEKYRSLVKTYQPLGVKCLIVTGDHPDHDRRLADGDFQLAVVIYEKLDLLLCSYLDALNSIGLIVIDELQMIADKSRGPILERLLTRIVASDFKPDLVALSAVISDESTWKLADWLSAEVVTENRRPVDLQQGVVANGEYRYRLYNSGEEGTLPFKNAVPGEDALEAFVSQLAENDSPTLVFVKSRADTVNLAFKLAASVNYPPAKEAIEKLSGEESSFLLRTLKQTLSRGVGFHNSYLSGAQRGIVEQAFKDKQIKVIFSTTTLAMGVNLPAETVYLETVKYCSGTYDERPSLVGVTRAEFENMAGRAGRMGLSGGRPGRAVILAETEFERDVLWQQYIAPAIIEPVKSAADSLPTEDWLLHFVASRLIRRIEDIRPVLASTYRLSSGEEWPDEPLTVIDKLAERELLTKNDQGNLTVTGFGRAVAETGLGVAEAEHLKRELERSIPESRLGWLALALSTTNWNLPPGILSRSELASGEPIRMLFERFGQSAEEALPILGDAYRSRPLTFRQAASLKALLLLDDWCRLVAVQRLEERYQIHLGQIVSLAESTAHLLVGLAALIGADDAGSGLPERLRLKAFSVRYGLPVEMRPIHRLLSQVLNRSEFSKLYHEGLHSPGDLIRLSSQEMEKLITDPGKLLIVKYKIELIKEEVDMAMPQENSYQTLLSEPGVVEIDGTCESERYLVRIDGFPVRLTGKSFKYFARLAWSRMKRDSGWIYKEDIELGFNQARYLYRMKNEIKASLKSGWGIVENNRMGYYRLDLPPDKIRINCENLKSHPDFEVRSLVAKSELSGAEASATLH